MATLKALIIALAGFSVLGVDAGPCRASSSSSSTTPSTSTQTPSSVLSNTPTQTPPTTTSSSVLSTSSTDSTTSTTTSSAPVCQLTVAIQPTNDRRRESIICGQKGLVGSSASFFKAVTGVTFEQCASECYTTFGCASIIHDGRAWCALYSQPVFALQIDTSQPAYYVFDSSCFSCGDSTSPSTTSSAASTSTSTSQVVSTTPAATPNTPTTTPGASYTPFCTRSPTTIEAGPPVVSNSGFEDPTTVNGEVIHSSPWFVSNGDVRQATSSLHAHNGDWFFYMENPSQSSPATAKQWVNILPRTPYDFTFWYSLPEIPDATDIGNQGCTFSIGDADGPENLNSKSFGFLGSGLIANQYYQESIRFESYSGWNNMPLSLTVWCHGTYDADPIVATILIDDIVVPKAPRQCGTRAHVDWLRHIPMLSKTFSGPNALDQCVDLCWQTTNCMTISYDGATCRLWAGTAYTEHFEPLETGESVVYEMVCFTCSAVPATTLLSSTTTTTTSAVFEPS